MSWPLKMSFSKSLMPVWLLYTTTSRVPSPCWSVPHVTTYLSPMHIRHVSGSSAMVNLVLVSTLLPPSQLEMQKAPELAHHSSRPVTRLTTARGLPARRSTRSARPVSRHQSLTARSLAPDTMTPPRECRQVTLSS